MFSLILVFNFRFVIYCCLFFNNIMKTTASFGLAFFKLLVNVRSSSMFSYLNSNKTQFLDNAQIFFFFNANTNRCCYLFITFLVKKMFLFTFSFIFPLKLKLIHLFLKDPIMLFCFQCHF